MILYVYCEDMKKKYKQPCTPTEKKKRETKRKDRTFDTTGETHLRGRACRVLVLYHSLQLIVDNGLMLPLGTLEPRDSRGLPVAT